jgi:hypothetical protein
MLKSASQAVGGGAVGLLAFKGVCGGTSTMGWRCDGQGRDVSRLRCVCICRKIENGYCGMSSQEGMYYFQVEEEKRGMLVVVLLEDTWTVM